VSCVREKPYTSLCNESYLFDGRQQVSRHGICASVEVTTRIGIVSDIHATAAPLREALSIFVQQGVDGVLCAGDIAGYGNELDQTVALLMESDCRAVLGNHDVWHLEDAVDVGENRVDTFFSQLPSTLELALDGIKLYMVHASPPRSYMDGIKLLDEHGCVVPERKQEWAERLAGFDSDVLVVGHTHQVFAERLGDTLVVNPGSTKFNHTCAILDLPAMECQVFPLSNKTPLRTWNWGVNRMPADGGSYTG